MDLNSTLAALEKQVESSSHQLDEKFIGDVEHVKHQLKIMYTTDQTVREELIGVRMDPKAKIFLEKMDQFHTQHLKKILAHYGWVTISKFGKEADTHAWLLVQHADHDPHFQASCAYILQHLVRLKETDAKNYAYLYDRVAIKFQHLGFKQKYGTQVDLKDDTWALFPFEGSIEDVNEHRRQVGLEPVENYLNLIKKIYTK